MKLGYFGGNNYAATAAEYLYMPCAKFTQLVDQILKLFDVAALIGAYRYGVCIFLYSCLDNLLHRAIVGKVNHFYTTGLQNSAHDIYSGVVSVEEARCGDEAEWVLGLWRRIDGVGRGGDRGDAHAFSR